MFKPLIKTGVRRLWPARCEPVLVASMGRSGSTLVYDSVVAGMARLRFGPLAEPLRGAVRDTAWSLDTARFHRGRVYKTHDFPHGLGAQSAIRAIFLFGDAGSAARSVLNCETTRGRAWIEEHFEHLRASGSIEDVPHADVLRFGEQLDAWLSFEAVPVLSLRYEDLWADGTEALIGRYVGFPVALPKRKARESAARDFGDREAALSATYGPLDERIAALPSVKANAKAQALLDAARAPGGTAP